MTDGPRLRAPIDTPMDLDRIEKAVRELLEAIGEDSERDGLIDTPVRVARLYAEIAAGLHEDPAEHLTVTFEAGHDEMVMRSEEHTSELQSLMRNSYAVFCLKKKK